MELTVNGYGTFVVDPTNPKNRGVHGSDLWGWMQAITNNSNLTQLPNQSGRSGLYLTTNGSTLSWSTQALTSSDVTTALGYVPYDSANPSGYISGITSGNVTFALGYVPYDAANPAAYISANQSINLNGEVLGTGITAIATTMLQPVQSITATTSAITTTATYISPAFSIGANTLVAGASYVLTIYGRFTNGLLSAGTSTFVVRLGTAGTTADAAVQTLALTSALSGTSVPFKAEFQITVRAAGASGSVIGSAVVTNNGILGLLASAAAVVDTGTPVTINTTQALKLGVSFSTSNTSISAVFDQAVVTRQR